MNKKLLWAIKLHYAAMGIHSTFFLFNVIRGNMFACVNIAFVFYSLWFGSKAESYLINENKQQVI